MFVLFLHSVLKSIAESKDLHYKKNVSKTLKPFNVKHFTVYQKNNDSSFTTGEQSHICNTIFH